MRHSSALIALLSMFTPPVLAGTPYLVKDIDPITSSYPWNQHAIGCQLLFVASDGTAPAQRIWRTDGTDSGTETLIDPGIESAFVGDLVRFEDKLMFTSSGADGRELWRTDGTTSGTIRVSAMNPVSPGSTSIKNLTVVGDTLFFAARDGAHGEELWASDGETARMVVDLDPGLDGAFQYGGYLAAVGDTLLFGSEGLDGVWKSDGTAAGTVLVHEIDMAGGAALGHLLLFAGRDDSNQIELWRSDGTTDGTYLVSDLNASGSSSPQVIGGDELFRFVIADDAVHGRELWRSDGTPAGTTLLMDINPGPKGSSPQHLTPVGDRLLFTADDGFGREVWVSDGTVGGTRMVRDVAAGTAGEPRYLAAVGDRVFFSADDGVHGREPWVTDGTETGTTLVADICTNECDSDARGFAASGGTLYFNADDGVTGGELWAIALDDVGDLLRGTQNDIVTPSRPKSAVLPLDPTRDAYLGSVRSGNLDPDAGVLEDMSNPLVFYAVACSDTTLYLTNTDTGRVRVEF